MSTPNDLPADAADFRRRAARLLEVDAPAYRRMWDYYRNPAAPAADAAPDEAGASDRPYRQAQEWGLPARITGLRAGRRVPGVARKEVVVENDIGWRVDTQVDYLFGRPVVLDSAAADPARRREIGELLRLILAANGGLRFLQQLALLGGVYGFVDVLVKLNPPAGDSHDPRGASVCDTQSLGQPPLGSALSLPIGGGKTLFTLACLAGRIRLEVVEPQRALPLLNPADSSRVDAYAQVYEIAKSPEPRDPPPALRVGILSRLLPAKVAAPAAEDRTVVVDLLTPTAWRRYEGERLVAEGENALGVLPLVHIQNLATPFDYAGVGDVEPLMPLQDELNTRLSDRAHRLALQSFKMYLGKGVEDFLDNPVAPGRMWTTDNPDAQLIEFGGDASCPSEEAHLSDLREALDKVERRQPHRRRRDQGACRPADECRSAAGHDARAAGADRAEAAHLRRGDLAHLRAVAGVARPRRAVRHHAGRAPRGDSLARSRAGRRDGKARRGAGQARPRRAAGSRAARAGVLSETEKTSTERRPR